MRTGRPTFQVSPDRLRSLREEANLTQAELARRAYAKLNKIASSPTQHYQKIEKKGKTSKAMATALAHVLDTSIAVLQGESSDEAPAWVNRLEQLLRDQIAAGTNAALQAALEQVGSAKDDVRGFAVTLAERIEATQIGQQTAELARLAELTGWTEAQLMQTGSVHGHWVVLSTVRGARTTEIVLGVGEVKFRIERAVEKFMTRSVSDTIITLRETQPWLHVDVRHPHRADMCCSFSFVRCMPHASGLQWVNPNWRDRFLLDEPLLEWALANANFVVGFDGQVRPHDVRRLRLLLEDCSNTDLPRQIALIKGRLDDLPNDILHNFMSEGRSHELAINWIVTDMWPELAPHLHTWPSRCWTIRLRTYVDLLCIDLVLDVSRSLAASLHQAPYFGTKYRLRLIEELDSQQLRPAPWRKSSIDVAVATLQERLKEECGDLGVTNASRRTAPPD